MARSITKPRDRNRISKRTKSHGLTPLTSQMEDFVRDISNRDDTPLEPLNIKQKMYIANINSNIVTFGVGPAGTGKSYIATVMAAEALLNSDVDRILITRPIVEAGEELGFLPGEQEEKTAPYFAPIRYILERRLGAGAVEMFIKSKRIAFLPLAFMRGHTFDNSFVILDEAQNTTPTQMKLFLTRLGENCKVIVDGDPRQKDIPGLSGLSDAMRRMNGVLGVGHVEFTKSDIVRSGIVQRIIERYEDDDEHRQGVLNTLGWNDGDSTIVKND